jgi:hypothetical protein
MINRVGMVRAYYENPLTLRAHLDEWNGLSTALAANLHAIVSDDGSPDHPAEPVVRGARCQVQVRLFRIDVDVRWNWLAARNVAMHHAPDGWYLITDMDHFAPEPLLRELVSGEWDEGTIYRFSRREHDGRSVHPHPNSWFMTRAMFWKIGGFNEAASGYYGTDGSYRRRAALAAPVVILPLELVRHERVGDASTTRYRRKQPEDGEGKRILRQWGDRPPKVLSFPYHEVRL